MKEYTNIIDNLLYSPTSMLQSLRSRIFGLFVVAFLFSIGALVYTLRQFETIGMGLYAINACYLPVADETSKLDIIAFQLQREQDRLTQPNADMVDKQFLNAEFYIKELDEGLQRTAQILNLARKGNIVEESHALDPLEEKTQDTLASLENYRHVWQNWKSTNNKNTTQELEKYKSKLVVSIRQLTSLVSVQIIQVSQQTDVSRKKAQNISSVLLGFSAVLWIALVFLAVRVLRPIAQLTTQVQRVRKGHRVEVLEGGISSEVSVLYTEFNQMADAVNERDQRLSERAVALNDLSQRLQQAIDSMHVGIFVVEHKEITMLNSVATEMWKFTVGQAEPDWLRNHETGVLESQAELSIQNRIIQLDVGNFGQIGHIIVTEDITEKVHTRNMINRTQRLAVIGKMLAQVTHEIRNPLNAMSLNVEMLSEETISPQGMEMLDIINKEIKRLEKTTERYLALSKPPELQIQLLDILPIVQQLIRYEGEGVEYRIEGESIAVFLDENIIRRALRNLFRNAKEAGASHITITMSHNTDTLCIDIIDNGQGLSEDTKDSLFEPFFTTKAQGTGLGLAICKQELEYFQATLELLPMEKTGFRLTIPILDDKT